MVYESDFYTTRRPYTRPSTYSLTSAPLRYIPSIGKVHTVSSFYPSYGPITGHRRMIMSRAAPHSVVTIRVRPSVVIREMDRIEHKVRSNYAYSPSEDFLCSNSSKVTSLSSLYPYSYYPYYRPIFTPKRIITIRWKPSYVNEIERIDRKVYSALYPYYPSEYFFYTFKNWEDESRKIRAQTNSLLQRVNASVPRASSVIPITTLARYNEPVYPSRLSCDNYLSRLIMPIRNVARDINSMSWYAEPAKRFTGKGHLACLRYSGNKAYSNRRTLCQDMSVRDDVNLLSFYAKNRLAAAGLALDAVTVQLLPYRPSRKFQPPALMEDPGKDLKASKAERLERFNAAPSTPSVNPAEAERLAERKQKRQEEAKLAEERALQEELAKKKEQAKRQEATRAAELARQEELAAQAATERAAELERKAEIARQADEEARQAEEEAAVLAEQAKLADDARLAEEARVIEDARLAEEAKKAQEEAAKKAEEERIAAEEEESRQRELARLEEIEKQAAEDKEAELASQAAELAEIARQESELAALAKQEAELAELERQEAELAALDAEAKALEEESAATESAALIQNEQAEEETNAPIVEEPETPEVEQQNDEVSESQDAEAEVTEEEEE